MKMINSLLKKQEILSSWPPNDTETSLNLKKMTYIGIENNIVILNEVKNPISGNSLILWILRLAQYDDIVFTKLFRNVPESICVIRNEVMYPYFLGTYKILDSSLHSEWRRNKGRSNSKKIQNILSLSDVGYLNLKP